MNVYKLNEAEIEKINQINERNCKNKTNVLMIISDYGFGPCISHDDLTIPVFIQFNDSLGVEIDLTRKLEIEERERGIFTLV